MNKRGVEEGYLHGSDVPSKTKSFEIIVDHIRLPKNSRFNALAIIDLEKDVYGCNKMAVNQGNLETLLDKFALSIDDGIEELDAKAAGKKLTVRVVLRNNPQINEMVRGLEIV